MSAEIHEAAAIFPLLEGAELNALVESVRVGFDSLFPIVRYQGKILDGRNRLRACELAGVRPLFTDLPEASDPYVEAWKYNGTRRDLEPDQKAAIYLRLGELSGRWRHEREERQRAANEARSQAIAARPRDERGRALPSGASRDARLDTAQPLAPAIPHQKEPPGLKAAPIPKKTSSAIAKEAGVSQGTIERVQKLQRQAPERFESVIKGKTKAHAELKTLKRQERIEKIVEISEANEELETEQSYPVIYADPPWRYEHVKTDNRAIENQYPTMELAEICALRVQDLASEDAVLFLWATSPKLAEAMQVITAWSFTYRTCMIWVKNKIGMGYYARQRHELLLIATRGELPVPKPENRPDSVVHADRGKHSEKPTEFAELIETMYPELPRIELFCRKARKGWAVWGNQSAAARGNS